MYLCRETQPRVGWSIPRPGGSQLGPDSCFPGLVTSSEELEGEGSNPYPGKSHFQVSPSPVLSIFSAPHEV